ncbi:hypothetical protein IH992_17950 [Candidatus Poribacteria bacterium]|nr:hypothetical protein [Candidatus Poribacteria bacterium]
MNYKENTFPVGARRAVPILSVQSSEEGTARRAPTDLFHKAIQAGNMVSDLAFILITKFLTGHS